MGRLMIYSAAVTIKNNLGLMVMTVCCCPKAMTSVGHMETRLFTLLQRVSFTTGNSFSLKSIQQISSGSCQQ